MSVCFIFAPNKCEKVMKKWYLFVYFISLVVSGVSAQNWDINTLHRVNGWDGRFIRNYNKVISRSEPYVAVGVPVAMAVAAWGNPATGLLKAGRLYPAPGPRARG